MENSFEGRQKKILLFVPMYNCEKQIVRVIEQLKGEVAKFITEAIFVNNCSADESEKATAEKLASENFPFVAKVFRNNENYGLGGSHKVAFDYAIKNGFDYVLVLHGDDQGRASDFLPILNSGEAENYDCVLGARFMKGSKLIGYSKFRTFGNRVYNALFCIVCKIRIWDLGSGLNMYNVKMLRQKFYEKFPDDLTFNYCMVMALSFFGHNAKFFPISWRETDQVSNVKMTKQAFVVLKMLFSFALKKKKFLECEHRKFPHENYSAQTVFFAERKK